jgi:uracil phosphoribosyltransferase
VHGNSHSLVAPDEQLRAALSSFAQPGIDRSDAMRAIAVATRILVESCPDADSVDLLVPVLRAGLAMFPVADALVGYVDVWFSICKRTDGGVDCDWTRAAIGTRPRHAMVLDVIAARGDTVVAVAEELTAKVSSLERISSLVCFATPEALEQISAAASVPVCMTVGSLCDSVDADGYVVPSTNGDAGDKLFARSSSRTSIKPASLAGL